MNENDRKVLRKIAREAEVQAMRDGRRHRAVTIPNKKKQAQIDACRTNRKREP
jgi:hypothetical protein